MAESPAKVLNRLREARRLAESLLAEQRAWLRQGRTSEMIADIDRKIAKLQESKAQIQAAIGAAPLKIQTLESRVKQLGGQIFQLEHAGDLARLQSMVAAAARMAEGLNLEDLKLSPAAKIAADSSASS